MWTPKQISCCFGTKQLHSAWLKYPIDLIRHYRLEVNTNVRVRHVLVIGGYSKPPKKKIDISYASAFMWWVFSAPFWTCYSITARLKI